MNIGNSYAQDIINPPKFVFTFNQNTLINRDFNHFIKGSNWWSAGKQLDSAIGLNAWHYGDSCVNSNMLNDNQMIINQQQYLHFLVQSFSSNAQLILYSRRSLFGV